MKIAMTLLLGAWLAFAGTGEVQAQCSKRILVYIDTSQSMQELYRRTLESLRQLLNEEDFVQDGDVVEIKLFGESIKTTEVARGPEKTREVLDKLLKIVPGEVDTNLGAVFTDVENALAGHQGSQQVVILASDLAHDPRSTPSDRNAAQANSSDWLRLFERSEKKLVELFGKGSKTPLVLFVAPSANAADREVQRNVEPDLSPETVPGERLIRLDSDFQPAKLVAAIKKAFLYSLDVSANLKKGNLDTLEVQVRNRNCIAVELDQVILSCPGSSDGAIEHDVPSDRRILPPNNKESLQVIDVPKPTFSCGNEYVVTVRSVDNEVEGSTEGTNETWLTFQPVEALVEHNLIWGNVLHVVLELGGLAVGPWDYTIEVSLGSDPDAPIASGVFTVPDNLDPQKPQRYRATFRIPDAAKERLEDAPEIRIAILESRSEPAMARTRKDIKQSWTNAAQLIATPAAVLLWVLSLIRRRSLKRAIHRAGDLITWMEGFKLLIQFVVLLLAWLLNSLRAFLIRTLDLLGADVVKWVSLIAVGFLVTAVLWRVIEQARLERDVVEGHLNDIDKYVARMERGWWPWLSGALFCTLLVVSTFFLIPKDEPTVDRHIQALHVTAT